MGVVYKAQDTKLDRFVALKFLPQNLNQAEEEKQRFIHEAKAASALDHPNICTVHEIDETEDGQMFIAMACYEGESLKERIERGPMAINEAIDITIQISQGLIKAHSKDIIHRDIKPANILITEDDTVKIVDFGLAKLAGRTMLTKEGTTLGTASYMSPEQTQGTNVDHRTDVWSLGVVLYEMITGRQPFQGDYGQAIMYAIMNEDAEPITGVRTGVPMELERIANKALAKSADERYQHVDEMIVDMKAVRKELESPDRSATGISTTAKSGKPKKVGKILIAPAVLLVAIAILILRPFFEEQPLVSSPRPVAVMPFKNQTGDKSFDYLREAIPNLLITNLEQSKYLSVLTWERMQDLLNAMGNQEFNVVDIDKDIGFELCRLDGIHEIVLGSFTKAGDVFATDIKVLDVGSKKLLKSANSTGEGVGSILKTQIDELSKSVSRGLISASAKVAEENFKVADVTTHSMEAFRHYREGVRRLSNFDTIGARASFERAVQLDPTFAMANYFLGKVNRRLWSAETARIALQKAMKYSVNVTEKEALFIEMDYAEVVEGDPEKALMINEELAQRFPREKTAHQMLGSKYRRARRVREAIKAFNRAIKLDPNWGNVYNELGYVYAQIGDYENARECLEKYVSLSPEGPNPYDSLGEVYLMMGSLDEVITTLELASQKFPNWYSGFFVTLAYAYALQENYDKALQQFDELQLRFERSFSVEQDPELLVWTHKYNGLFYYLLGRYKEALTLFRKQRALALSARDGLGQARAHELMAFVYAEMGDSRQAETELQACLKTRLKVSPQDNLHWQLSHGCISGLIDVKAGKVDSAKEKLRRVTRMLSEVQDWRRQVYANWSALLAGEVALVEEHTGEAIQTFRQASPINPYRTSWWFRYLYSMPISRDGLARAYYASGDLDKAIAEYRRLVTFDPMSKERFLINPKYHYRLAKLYEEKGQPDSAIKEYEKFLEIWKDADEGLSELAEAKTRLAELESTVHK